jgi:hypothetical protein
MARLLSKGIQDSTKGWVTAIKQTVTGLQGLPQPEGRTNSWQLAWHEVTDVLLEGEEVQIDADMTTQRKRLDA